METILKYKNWLIGAAILLILVIGYFAFFKNKGDVTPPETGGCPSTFTLNPLGSLVSGAVSVTYSTVGGKYYAQDRGGIAGFSAQLPPKEISLDKFKAACKAYQSQSATQ